MTEVPDKDGKKVAQLFNCYPGDDVWAYLCEHGPPNKEHNIKRVELAWRKKMRWQVKTKAPSEDKTAEEEPAQQPQERQISVDYGRTTSEEKSSEEESTSTNKSAASAEENHQGSADNKDASREAEAKAEVVGLELQQRRSKTQLPALDDNDDNDDKSNMSPGHRDQATHDKSPAEEPCSVVLKDKQQVLEEKMASVEEKLDQVLRSQASGSDSSRGGNISAGGSQPHWRRIAAGPTAKCCGPNSTKLERPTLALEISPLAQCRW